MTFAASATLMLGARWTPASMMAPYAAATRSSVGGVLAGDDLRDLLERVLLVARVDALGRVAEREVRPALEAGRLLEDGPADLLGHARVDRRLVDDDRALAEGLPHRLGRALDRGEVRDVVVVDRRGDGDDEEGAPRERLQVARHVERRCLEHLAGHLVVAVVAAAELVHLLLVDVEADGAGNLRANASATGSPT